MYIFTYMVRIYLTIYIERLTVNPVQLIFMTYISMNEGNDTYVFCI